MLTEHELCVFLAFAFLIWVDKVPEKLKSFVINFKLLWLLFCIFIVLFGSSILGAVDGLAHTGRKIWILRAGALVFASAFLVFPFIAHVFVYLVYDLVRI